MSLTRINGEPVKLVESFGELREGMVVWQAIGGGCLQCGKERCRHLVMSLVGEPCGLGEPTIEITPCNPRQRRAFVCVCAVRDRELFRVTDEKLESESAAKSRELERVR